MVGIDARQGPLDLCASLDLTAHVLIDVSKMSAEEAVKLIDERAAEANPGKERPSGADGKAILLPSSERLIPSRDRDGGIQGCIAIRL